MHSLIDLLSSILTLFTYAVVARAVLSWIRPNPYNPLVRFLNRITDPIMRPLERLIPPIGGLDVTPIVAIVLIQLIRKSLPMLLGAY